VLTHPDTQALALLALAGHQPNADATRTQLAQCGAGILEAVQRAPMALAPAAADRLARLLGLDAGPRPVAVTAGVEAVEAS
jgi:hypothetical protein